MSNETNEEKKTQESTADLGGQQLNQSTEERQAENQELEQNSEVLGTIDEYQQNSHTESEVNDQIQALKVENDQLKDSVLRAQAEAQNIRYRAQKDIEKARKYGLEKFINELLPVADNLERALDAADKNNDSQEGIIQGVELTFKSLQDILKRFGVESIEPQGEPFDPQLHQAVSIVPNANVEPNTVLNVFQKGYKLNGRLVRPAMVVVSSSASDNQN